MARSTLLVTLLFVAPKIGEAKQTVLLVPGKDGAGLVRVDNGRRRAITCEPLPGAWGLWVDDVNGDGIPEAVVALRKPARFDPVLENRLHVYSLRQGRCVPLWRGTRLAGRFERIGRVRGGRLLALERIGGGRRWLARYRWTGFGYGVERVLWRGRGLAPARLLGDLDGRKGRP